jgi:hypothetical protein
MRGKNKVKSFHQSRIERKKKSAVTFSQLTLHKLNWLEWVAIILSLWFLFYPRPYIYLFSILLALPVIGLILNGLNKPSIASLVEITKDEDGDNKYDVADFIDFPAMVILVRVLLDFEFDNLSSIIFAGAISFAGVLTLLFLTHKTIVKTSRSKTWIYLSLIFNICLYSYVGTCGANCIYDKSTPEVYETRLLGKHTYTTRKSGTRYYFTVAPWGHHYDKEDIKVTSGYYYRTEVGDTIKIDYKKGLLGIPWYHIE